MIKGNPQERERERERIWILPYDHNSNFEIWNNLEMTTSIMSRVLTNPVFIKLFGLLAEDSNLLFQVRTQNSEADRFENLANHMYMYMLYISFEMSFANTRFGFLNNISWFNFSRSHSWRSYSVKTPRRIKKADITYCLNMTPSTSLLPLPPKIVVCNLL